MSPSKKEKELWNAIAELGCIACRKDGRFNPYVLIHHCDGRTKPGAHKKVLALCAGHHQDGSGAIDLIAVHPYKARFEAKYGTQEELMQETKNQLIKKGLITL